MNIQVKPLSASDIRALARTSAVFFSHLLDNLPCGHDLSYDDAVAVAARLMVENGPIFCDLVCRGTGLTDPEVQATPWPEVVRIGCEVIEATREAWRPAWTNGFLQRIVSDELRPFSSFVQKAAR